MESKFLTQDCNNFHAQFARVKGYKCNNDNRSIIATSQPTFHVTCTLAKLLLLPSVHVQIV